MSDKRIGNEAIHVLNDKYQFVSAQQVQNAKWLDLDNVVSVKRDKTIYAIRSRTNFDFNNQDDNVEFFSNLNGDSLLGTQTTPALPYGNLLSSQVFKNFNQNINNIFEGSSDLPVYGNGHIDRLYGNSGWAGTLDNGFNLKVINQIVAGQPGAAADDEGKDLNNRINITSNVSVYANSTIENKLTFNPHSGGGWLYIDGNVKTIKLASDGINTNVSNILSSRTLFMSNMTTNHTRWNRLINANVGHMTEAGAIVAGTGNVIATASTDPCDYRGNAIGYSASILHSSATNMVDLVKQANVATNEAYRYQFAIRRNQNSIVNENPIYIGRISRFGTKLNDVNGNISNIMSIDSFSSNFFAHLPSDNEVYYNAVKAPTEFSITGNYKSTEVIPFGGNFGGNYLDGNVGNLTGNLFSNPLDPFYQFVTVGKYNALYNDYIVAPNLTLEAPTNFTKNDKFTVVQCNINMSSPFYLFDRLNITREKYKKPSEILVGTTDGTTFNEISDPITTNIDSAPASFITRATMMNNTLPVIDSKVVHLSFYNIVANNWQSTTEVQPSNTVTPDLVNTPNMAEYTSGNTIQLYLRRGFITLDNFSDINTSIVTSNSKYFNTIPSYLKSYKEPEGGIYIEDASVTFGGNLASNCVITSTFDLSDGIPVTANISPDLCFYVFANADISNRVDRRANVVIPFANTILSNVWSYDNFNTAKIPITNSITFDPKISYNTFDGLTINNPFAKKNLIYTVKFGKVLGESNLSQDKPSLTQYGFFANLNLDGSPLLSNIANVNQINGATSITKLLDNDHMNGLLLNGVAYSEYEFTNFSYKFTDLGNVSALNLGNYKYSSVLPITGNLLTSLGGGAPTAEGNSLLLRNVQDNYMNILVDYVGSNISGLETDIHRVVIYDNHYRYYISSVQKTGGAPIDNSTRYRSRVGGVNTESDDVFDIMPGKGAIGSVIETAPAAANNQSIKLGPFLSYTYEKVFENSSQDVFYPFCTPQKVWADRVSDGTNSDNYLFPGFQWKYTGQNAELHNYKDESNCDFVIANNIKDSEQVTSVVIFSADNTTRTLKVGLSTDNNTKSINVRPIRLGGLSGDMAQRQWYTPIVIKISGESNSYLVLLVNITVSTDGLNTFTGLPTEYSFNTPVSININSIEKTSDNFNQIMFKSKLRVYKQLNNALDTTYYTNTVNLHKTKLSNFSYSNEFGASNTNVSLNFYSIPTNNLVVNYAYTKSAIRKLMNYTQTDYELDNSVNYNTSSEAAKYKKIVKPVSGLNFATSKENLLNTEVVDGHLPRLGPNTTRFYLDGGFGEDVYVDYLNNSTVLLKNMMKFQLNRSVEWILTRQEVGSNLIETVGRGLLTRNPNMDVKLYRDYIISENATTNKSGFFMNVKTNISDLASHLLLQKRQTEAMKMNTTPQFVLYTKADTLSVSLFHENPSTLSREFIRNVPSPTNYVDLGRLFAADPGVFNKVSRLPEFEFDLIRSLSSTNVNTQNVSDALFRVRIRLDNYSIVHNRRSVNRGHVLFSSDTNVISNFVGGTSLGVNLFTNLKRSLNYDFLNITNPSVFGNDHKLIKIFKHLGFGKVDTRVYDFNSHYENELPSQELVTTAGAAMANAHPSFNFPTSAAYNFVPPANVSAVTKEILYDPTVGIQRFYINLGSSESQDRVYFRNTGLASQPITINDTETFLLYTGTRAIGFLTYENTSTTVNTLGAFLRPGNAVDMVASFGNGTRLFNDRTGLAFKSGSFTNAIQNNDRLPASTNAAARLQYRLFYSVALINRNNDKPIYVRGVSYKFNNSNLFSINGTSNNLFGVFRSLTGLLDNVKFNFVSQNITTSYSVDPVYKGNQFLINGPENITDRVLTYGMQTNRGGAGVNEKNELFKMKFFGSADQITNFKVTIAPSTLQLYQAMDVNENGELDTPRVSVSDLNQSGLSSVDQANATRITSSMFNLNTAFSELLYNLKSNPSNSTVYRAPHVVQTINLNGNWNEVVGSGLDIKLNKKWAVGYNLDCFFAFRNNNLSTFDVISIDTDRQNTSASVASLKVQNSLPLVIGNKNTWARSKGYTEDSNDHCGLTFKVKENVKITQGDIVRLFVDNTPIASSVSVNVTVAGKDPKAYKLSDYDNETYSRLLDKQVKLENKFA